MIAKTSAQKPVALSLFSGVGGLDLGFSRQYRIALAIENDPPTTLQYALNFPETDVWMTDISQLEASQIQQRLPQPIDLIIGGPSCQGFSRQGKRNPDDPRNQNLFHFARLVCNLHPRAFVLENVPGLKDTLYAPLVKSVWTQLESAGYQLHEWQLNAADYGVPQSRHRVFWIGTLGIPLEPPTPLPPVTVAEALASLESLEPQLQLNQDILSLSEPLTLNSYLQHLHHCFTPPADWDETTLSGCALTHHSAAVIHRFLNTPGGETEPISHLYRLNAKGLCPTLTAGSDEQRGRHTPARPIHPQYPRVITTREAARLSSFPDWFQFHHTKWRSLRQIGNAVPPLLANAIATALLPVFSAEQPVNTTLQFVESLEETPTLPRLIHFPKVFDYGQAVAFELQAEQLVRQYRHALRTALYISPLEFGRRFLDLQEALGKQRFRAWLNYYLPDSLSEIKTSMTVARFLEQQPELADSAIVRSFSLSFLATLSKAPQQILTQFLQTCHELGRWSLKQLKTLMTQASPKPQKYSFEELQQLVAPVGILKKAVKGQKLSLERPVGDEISPFPIVFKNSYQLLHWWQNTGQAFAEQYSLTERSALESESDNNQPVVQLQAEKAALEQRLYQLEAHLRSSFADEGDRQVFEAEAKVSQLTQQLQAENQTLNQQLKALQEQYQSSQLYMGAQVWITDGDYLGERGEIVERKSAQESDWWILLDRTKAEGLVTRILCSSSQLKLLPVDQRLVELTKQNQHLLKSLDQAQETIQLLSQRLEQLLAQQDEKIQKFLTTIR